MKMTRFAFAGKWGCRGASGSSLVRPSSARSRATRPGSRAEPAASDRTKERREQQASLMASVQIEEFVRPQERARVGAPDRELRAGAQLGPAGVEERAGAALLGLPRRALEADPVRGRDPVPGGER